MSIRAVPDSQKRLEHTAIEVKPRGDAKFYLLIAW
jgi:hypothetical protein